MSEIHSQENTTKLNFTKKENKIKKIKKKRKNIMKWLISQS